MELSKCLGCMENYQGTPCPHCGYDPNRVKGQEYTLPPQTILTGKYLVGRMLGAGGLRHHLHRLGHCLRAKSGH